MTQLPNLITRIGMALLLIAGLTANTAAKDVSDIPVEWTEQPIQIDGQMGDWSDLSTRFLGEPKAAIGLACDSTHLYLILRFQDAQSAGIIKRTGLKFWIDPNGKKKEIFMLNYRGGPTPEEMQQLAGATGDRRPDGGMFPGDRPGGDRRLFVCSILDRIEPKSIPVTGTEGPQVSFGIDHGFFVYEFAIPLDEGGVRYYGLDATPGDKISIGVFWGDMSDMRQRGGGAPGGGMPGGGRGGMGGGGGRGGMGGGGGKGGGQRGGMGGDRPERPQPVEFWIKTKLADQADIDTD